jgi:RNA polymerase sigma-70 factor, ECF subfamily
MHPDWNDETLMHAFAGGDAHAFETLYARYRNSSFRFLADMGGTLEMAEQLFAELWDHVVSPAVRFDGSVRFSTWLFALAHQLLLGMYRTNAPAVADAFTAIEDAEDMLLTLGSGEKLSGKADPEALARLLPAALDMLPPPEREAFLLHEEAGIGVDQIAVIAGVEAPVAERRLIRAVEQLRAQLGQLL